MERVHTWAALDDVASADLNAIQDRARGAVPSSEDNDFATSYAKGSTGLVWQSLATIANADIFLLDASADWRDRLVSGAFTRVGANDRLGQSTDYTCNDPTASPARTTFKGYTGSGAVSNLTSGASVAAGSPPLNGAGTHRSYAVVIDDLSTSGNIFLYADPTSGELFLYNASGAAVHGLLEVDLSGDLNKR